MLHRHSGIITHLRAGKLRQNNRADIAVMYSFPTVIYYRSPNHMKYSFLNSLTSDAVTVTSSEIRGHKKGNET